MKIFYYFILSVSLLLGSCSENKNSKNYVTNTNTEMYLTHKDTTAVRSLVTRFMNYYKDGKYTDAAAMLYLQSTKKKEPQLLDNDELDKVIFMLKNNPIKYYSINNIEFIDAENNSVKCNVICNNDISLNYYFAPIRYLGGWRLCLKK